MLVTSTRRAGGRKSLRPPGRGQPPWLAGSLLLTAGVLLVASGVTLVTDRADSQAAPPPQAQQPVPAPVERGSRRFDADVERDPAAAIQPPLERAERPVRVGGTAGAAGVSVEAPGPSRDPEALAIPAMGVDQDVIELGVVGNDLQVPDAYSDIGWWSGGPAPGQAGAAVVVGHVDSPTGPAVFYQLSGLTQGARITVRLDDRSRAVFAVRAVRAYDRSQFPSSRVYRSGGRPTLHLLTCGGTFDRESDQYSSNVVVYADLVERIPPPGTEPGWYARATEDSKQKIAERREQEQRVQQRRERRAEERAQRLASDVGRAMTTLLPGDSR